MRYDEAKGLVGAWPFWVGALSGPLGTGLAWTHTTGFFKNAGGLFAMQWKAGSTNFDVNNGRVILNYVRLICDTPPTNATSLQCMFMASSVSKCSGGTKINPFIFVPGDNTSGSNFPIDLFYNPTLTNDAVNVISRFQLKPIAPVAGDDFLIVCGTGEGSAPVQGSTTQAGSYQVMCAPIMLGPDAFTLGNGASVILYMWAPGATGDGFFEIEAGMMVV